MIISSDGLAEKNNAIHSTFCQEGFILFLEGRQLPMLAETWIPALLRTMETEIRSVVANPAHPVFGTIDMVVPSKQFLRSVLHYWELTRLIVNSLQALFKFFNLARCGL